MTSLAKPEEGAGKLDEGQIPFGIFVEAGGDAAKLFEFPDTTLDPVALLIGHGIIVAWANTVALWRDDCHGLQVGRDKGQRPVRIVPPIRQHLGSGETRQQGDGLRIIARCATGEADLQWPSHCLNQQMQLRAEATTRTA